MLSELKNKFARLRTALKLIRPMARFVWNRGAMVYVAVGSNNSSHLYTQEELYEKFGVTEPIDIDSYMAVGLLMEMADEEDFRIIDPEEFELPDAPPEEWN